MTNAERQSYTSHTISDRLLGKTVEEAMEFEWDDENEFHLARHRVTPRIVAAIGARQPEFFQNKDGETGTHIMIGPDDQEQVYTVILLDLGDDRWRPITGWESSLREVEMFRKERGRHG